MKAVRADFSPPGAAKGRRRIVGGAQPIVFSGEDDVFKPWHNVKRRGHIVFKARILVDGLNTLCSSPATLCRRSNPCREARFPLGCGLNTMGSPRRMLLTWQNGSGPLPYVPSIAVPRNDGQDSLTRVRARQWESPSTCARGVLPWGRAPESQPRAMRVCRPWRGSGEVARLAT